MLQSEKLPEERKHIRSVIGSHIIVLWLFHNTLNSLLFSSFITRSCIQPHTLR